MIRKACYGTNVINLPDDGQDVEQIRAALAALFPEVATASYTVSGEEVTFTAQVGSKG
jgi:hypothetical protein